MWVWYGAANSQPERQPAKQLTNRRARRALLCWRGCEQCVDPLSHEVCRVGHGANAASLRRMRSEAHLEGQVFGGAPEIVGLFLGEFHHAFLPANEIFPFIGNLLIGRITVATFFVGVHRGH